MVRRWTHLIRGGAVLAALACAGVAAQDYRAGTVRGSAEIVDGDTLRIGAVKIRLFGIDAPERSQVCEDERGRNWPCGVVATQRLTALTAGRTVTCRPRDVDRYGRQVATCVGDADLGAVLVSEGPGAGLCAVRRRLRGAGGPLEAAARRPVARGFRGALAVPRRASAGAVLRGGRGAGSTGDATARRLRDQGQRVGGRGPRFSTCRAPAATTTRIDPSAATAGSATRLPPAPPASARRAGQPGTVRPGGHLVNGATRAG